MSIMSSRTKHEDQRKGQDGRLGVLEAAAHWEGGRTPFLFSLLVSLFGGRDA